MKKGKQIYKNQQKRTDLDCCVCKRQKECENRAEGKFCSRFFSETFKPGERDPVDVWEQERRDRGKVEQETDKVRNYTKWEGKRCD